ncbi:unnamed protein product [Wuchereria bancrofti]|uniref:Myosin N-terminal SH3-like domain-containing protein n=1 Tax=Wuchereria bancrofti TaxID=6293 RepID=A0A3P7EE70_WUCBA|nr:unnamed protein product [Wuchereria bancrofti]
MSKLESDHEKDPGWQYLRQTREQMAAEQSRPFDSKKNCWIPDAEEGYIAAEITSTKGDNVTVVSARGNEVCFHDGRGMVLVFLESICLNMECC